MSTNISSLTNTDFNDNLAQKVMSGGGFAKTYTYLPGNDVKPDGWIYEGQMDADGYIPSGDRLINVDKYAKHLQLVGAGKNGLSEKSFLSQKYMTILDEADKQQKLVDENPYIPVTQLLVGAAATGNNLIDTNYEVVRRVNYLSGVVSKQYFMADYNAIRTVNERRVNVLNAVGFKKTSALLEGIPEIGDHTTPPPARQDFGQYSKSLYADSFRWEFGMREKKDSVVNLVGEITREIPGLFAKMKDDKITTALNALTDAGAIAPDWDLITAGNFVYDTDAIEDVEGDETTLNPFPGPMAMIAPKKVIRVYHRNIHQVGIGSAEGNVDSQDPEGRRSGTLPGNPQVRYYINESITAASYIITKPKDFADLLKGPVVNVSYKNQLTPAQTEGRITFDFNGYMEKDSSAAVRHTSVHA